MIRRVTTGLAVIAALAVTAATVKAGTAATDKASGKAQVAGTAGSPRAANLTGTWQLDPKLSDVMRGPGGGRPPGGPGGGTERGPQGGWRGGPGGGGAPPARMPDLVRVTMTGKVVCFADSAGQVLKEITTLGGAKDDLSHASGAQVQTGEWKAGGLHTEHATPRGATIKEVITLDENGALLVIRTTMPAFGDRPAREVKRVYRRVGR